jgi:hypothetical protein
MTPDEENLLNQLERTLHGELTPIMVPMLNDVAIHAALLLGMSYEQLIMSFTEQLSKHIPGVVGVEIKMYGSAGQMPKPMIPKQQMQQQQAISKEEDEVARHLLSEIDWE